MIDTHEIEKQIKDIINSKVSTILSNENLVQIISQKIDLVIAERIPSIINAYLNNAVQKKKLDKELDTRYQEKLFATLDQEIRTRAAQAVSNFDMPTQVGKHILECVEGKLKVAALPIKSINHTNINFDGFTLSAEAIVDGTFSNFSSNGIQDVASQTELTVADQIVVIENTLVARNADIKENFHANDVSVNKLTINDQLIFNEKINRQFVSLIKDTYNKELSKRKIDIIENPIFVNGSEALTENSLGPSIINSNLRKLGRLKELSVSGISQFNDTLIVTDTGKVGINTQEPEGALTIWDDDCDLTIRRYKKKHMYVGTLRDNDLVLGAHGDPKLAIRKDGTVEINQIQISGIRISVSAQVPNRVGQPGEIVLMSDASEDEPWAYRCIGNDKWKAIK